MSKGLASWLAGLREESAERGQLVLGAEGRTEGSDVAGLVSLREALVKDRQRRCLSGGGEVESIGSAQLLGGGGGGGGQGVDVW